MNGSKTPTVVALRALVQLTPGPTWTNTVADAKTNAPLGWAWTNTTNVTSANEKTTTANGLYILWSSSTNYDWSGSTYTSSNLIRTYQGEYQEFIMRFASATETSAAKGTGFLIYSAVTNSQFSRISMGGSSIRSAR